MECCISSGGGDERTPEVPVQGADLRRHPSSGGRGWPGEGDPRLYKANLSHDRLTKYLQQLEESGLISKEQDGDRTAYLITDKGTRFIAEFRKMEEFADAFGLEI